MARGLIAQASSLLLHGSGSGGALLQSWLLEDSPSAKSLALCCSQLPLLPSSPSRLGVLMGSCCF